jgi:hypothetical protein
MASRYIRPEHKDLYIHNDQKQPVLIYRNEGPWPELPIGCWTSPNIIEFYQIDWNNQNADKPFITKVIGGTLQDNKIFMLKFFRIIRTPSQKQKRMIEEYGFYSMLKSFDQKRIDAGWWIDAEAGLEWKTEFPW